MNAPTSEPFAEMDDDQLVTLLRDTFASHERLAEVYRAHRIALAPVPSRRARHSWLIPMTAAAAVIAVAGVGVAVLPSHPSMPSSHPSVSVGTHPRHGFGPKLLPSHNASVELAVPRSHPRPTLGPTSPASHEAPVELTVPAYARLAAKTASRERVQAASTAELGRLAAQAERYLTSRLHATSVASAPAELRHLTGLSAGPGMKRTSYWSVPGQVSDVVAYVNQHQPRNTSLNMGGSGTGTDGVEDYTFDFDAGNTATYVLPQIGFAAVQSGSATLLRADVYVAPRSVRPANTFVLSAVSKVVVTLAQSGTASPQSVTVTGPTKIDELVTDFDTLPGSARVLQDWGCVEQTSTLSLRFVLASGETVVVREIIGCGPGTVRVKRGSTQLAATLDGTGFQAAVQAVSPRLAALG